MSSNGDEIIVVDYDPSWPAKFDEEKILLARSLEDWAVSIEHIGSTSVPGLCAKPVIDIMVGVRDLSGTMGRLKVLEELGYLHVPGDGDGERIFLRKGTPRTHHVHIVVYGGSEWDQHVRFREMLRNDPDLRERYASLKRESAKRYRGDRQAYVDSKNEIISSALRTND